MSLAFATTETTPDRAASALPPLACVEAARAVHYPLSRWYLRPLAGGLARRLADTRVDPWHVTLCGLLFVLAAAATLTYVPAATYLAAALVLGYWFCDRTDGQLARLRGAATEWGAWLDANVDELADLGLHAAIAYAAAQGGSAWAWPCFVAFVTGKYLLMYGLFVEPSEPAGNHEHAVSSGANPHRMSLLQQLYHLPSNADVRLHLLVLGILTGQFVVELACVALYYNFRWLVRYVLVARRLGATSS